MMASKACFGVLSTVNDVAKFAVLMIASSSKGSVRQNQPAGLVRLRADELEWAPLGSVEERLPATEHNWVNNEPNLVEQVRIQQAGDDGCSADHIDVLPGLVFQCSKLID